MKFRQSAPVFSIDGHEIGTIEHVVLDPRTKEIIYLIVQQGMIFADHRVVPVDWVSVTRPDRVILIETARVVQSLPQFEADYYIPVSGVDTGGQDPTDLAQPMHWYPVGAGMHQHPTEEVHTGQPREIPMNTRHTSNYAVALEAGAAVLDASGRHIGNVARVFTEDSDERATHFAISPGRLFNAEKLIPSTWVVEISEDEIRL